MTLNLLAIAALAVMGVSVVSGQKVSDFQKAEALDQAWSFTRDNFYDARMHGVDWGAVHSEFSAQLEGVQNPEGMRMLLRDMLARLRNSHMGVITRDELARIRTVLPFAWEEIGGRVFVSYVFGLKKEIDVPIQFGDEIVSVDGQPASQMRQVGVTHLDDVGTNPYTGMPGSIAEVRLRRQGRIEQISLARVHRSDDVHPWEARELPGGGFYLRLLTM